MTRKKASVLCLIALVAILCLIRPYEGKPLTAKSVRTLKVINESLVFILGDKSLGLAYFNGTWIWQQDLPVPMHWYKIKENKVLMYLRDGRFIIIDVLTGKTLFKKVTDLFCGAAIAENLLAISNGSHLTVYNISSGSIEWDLSKKLLGNNEIEVWKASNKFIVTRLSNGTFLVLDWTGRTLWSYPLARTSTFLWLSRTTPISVVNVLVSKDKVLIIWQNVTVFSDGKIVFSKKMGNVIALTAKQDMLVLVSSDKKLSLYSIKDNKVRLTISLPIHVVKVSINDKIIALQGIDDNVYLYDIKSGKPYCVLSFGEKILDLELSENTLVAALANSSILKFDLNKIHPRIYINETEKWVKQNSETLYIIKLLEESKGLNTQLIGAEGEVKVQGNTILVKIYPVKRVGNYNIVLYIEEARGSVLLSLKLHVTGSESNLYYWILAIALIASLIILIPTVLIKQEGFG